MVRAGLQFPAFLASEFSLRASAVAMAGLDRSLALPARRLPAGLTPPHKTADGMATSRTLFGGFKPLGKAALRRAAAGRSSTAQSRLDRSLAPPAKNHGDTEIQFGTQEIRNWVTAAIGFRLPGVPNPDSEPRRLGG